MGALPSWLNVLLVSLVMYSMVTSHDDESEQGGGREGSSEPGRKSPPTAVDNGVLSITMPGVTPHMDDEYMCTSIKLPKDQLYITQFSAIQDGDHAHHILLFGCEGPGRNKPYWDCMAPCQGAEIIKFAWAKNAKATKLPPNIGSAIGGPKTKFKYLVLQVHYKNALPDSVKDHSGIRMTTTTQKPKYLSGILILMSNWNTIPPHTPEYHIKVSCKFGGNAPLYPFAFRVHAHELSDVISAYQYNGSFHLLGKGNPLWPQAFYPVEDKHLVVKKGDVVAAECTYNSTNRDRPTHMGAKHTDEMCNFYLMFYTDPEKGKTFYECAGDNVKVVTRKLPAGSDVPLPPNPLLEDVALGNVEGIQEVIGWPSDKLKLGQVAGVTTDAKGNVHVFHRGSRKWTGSSFDSKNVFQEKTPIKENVLLTLDNNAKVIDQWGANMFYMPHGIHIDSKNNLWVTDVAMQQVMRFKPGQHTADLTLGEKFVPGSDYRHFCKPTSVATLSNGQFYVADGYCNSRVIKFSSDGKYLQEWGEHSSNILASGFPPPGTFSLPHSITLLENENLLCVADRLNKRIQCFDLEGKFLRQMHSEAKKQIYGVVLSPDNGLLYAVSGLGDYGQNKDLHGYVFDPQTSILIEKWAPTSFSFSQPHDIALSPHTKYIYVAEIGPDRLTKFSIQNATKGQTVAVEKSHPDTVDQEDDQHAQAALEQEGDTDFGASLIIGSLLVIPVVIIVIVTICLRLKKRDKDQKYTKLPQEDQEDI